MSGPRGDVIRPTTVDAETERRRRRPSVDRVGRSWAWTAAAVVAAAGRRRPDRDARRAASSRPNTEVWRQQWATRLPGEIVSTLVLVVGVGTLLGRARRRAGVARQPPTASPAAGSSAGRWCCRWPCPATSSASSRPRCSASPARSRSWWRDRFGADAWFPEVRSMPGAIVDALAHALPVRVPARPGRAARPGRPTPTSWPARSAPRRVRRRGGSCSRCCARRSPPAPPSS